jgi:hypothetical protein
MAIVDHRRSVERNVGIRLVGLNETRHTVIDEGRVGVEPNEETRRRIDLREPAFGVSRRVLEDVHLKEGLATEKREPKFLRVTR